MKIFTHKYRRISSKAAPLMWNDNWDNEKTYDANVQGSSGAIIHREHEPIWDRDYDPAIYGPLENADPDLMSTFITIMPADLPGTFEFAFGNGVKLWTDNLKSAPIEAGTPYSATTVPKSFYTEGIEAGSENVTLVYKYNDRIQDTKTLRADVVWLEAKQGTQRVIYANGEDITFTIKDLPPEYTTLKWDLDGDGTARSGDWEDMNTSVAIVKYSPAASDVGNIYLPEDAVNRRKEYAVTVELTGGYVLPLMFGTIRVAQDDYQGTAVATTTLGRRAEVCMLAVLPPMDPLPASGPNSAAELDKKYGTNYVQVGGNAIIHYSTKGLTCLGAVVHEGSGTSLKSYAVMISDKAYTYGFKREDIQAIALHEVRHVYQAILIRTPGTNWNIIGTNYSACTSLREADAQLAEFTSQASWKYMAVATEFYDCYVTALGACDGLSGNVKTAAKNILQEIYVGIPFIEMKKEGYNWYVRAPQ